METIKFRLKTIPDARGTEANATIATKIAANRSILIPNHLPVTRYRYHPCMFLVFLHWHKSIHVHVSVTLNITKIVPVNACFGTDEIVLEKCSCVLFQMT